MTIVFTNGCFDLIHVGHIRLLQYAKSLGDELVVGLNSDDSVRAIKGPRRPIVPQEERFEILWAIDAVDRVEIFYERTPLKLITQIRPDVLVKGPDYLESQIVGEEFVRSYGGTVWVPNWAIEHRTTELIKRIREMFQ